MLFKITRIHPTEGEDVDLCDTFVSCRQDQEIDFSNKDFFFTLLYNSDLNDILTYPPPHLTACRIECCDVT